MPKKEHLTEFIQIRVNKAEKIFIQLMARKYYRKGVSELVMSLVYQELSRLSRLDEEINEKRIKFMQEQYYLK